MTVIQSQLASRNHEKIKVVPNETRLDYPRIRPQRLHTWFNLIPVDEFEQDRPGRILFLDSFAVVRKEKSGSQPYRVFFEGDKEMAVVVRHGIIFVWYGDDLMNPDRPFPTLFEEPYPTRYITSVPTIFENTHVMDFVENGSDNLHFKHVHLWEHSRIFNHKITPEVITLEQDTRFHYGRCSFNPVIRAISYILPELELRHDYAYHGPTIAVVGAEGKGSPESHAIVTLTPEGENRTRVRVTIGMPESTFPPIAEKVYQVFTGGRRKLCEKAAGIMANYIKNEFDVDAVIWKNRKVMHHYNLLPSEKHLQDVIEWGKTFYPKDFVAPPQPEEKPDTDRSWVVLDRARNIKQGKIKSFKVGTESVIAYRDSKNRIHVKDAYCPHQGAHLGVQGKIVKDCVRCPFHGFHFSSEDGSCRGANPDNTTNTIEGLKLKAIEYRINKGRVEVLV